MKQIIVCIVCVAVFTLLFACQWKKTFDLSPYGLPAVIEVPSGVKVNAIDLVVMKEINLVKDRFNMQIFIRPASGDSLEYLLEKHTDYVNGIPGIQRIIHIDGRGMIFETMDVEEKKHYGFRLLLINDSMEVVVQDHMRFKYKKRQIESMYKSATTLQWK